MFIKVQSKLYLECMACGPYSRVQYSEAGTAVTPECGPYNTYSAHREYKT